MAQTEGISEQAFRRADWNDHATAKIAAEQTKEDANPQPWHDPCWNPPWRDTKIGAERELKVAGPKWS
ncbi:hypothetical protein SBA2_430012 [Acidobacteriia bacterium SbA2]|nr:hypothetical protein SBA2_430012 [Acidobacteriia bacterium SbA2]